MLAHKKYKSDYTNAIKTLENPIDLSKVSHIHLLKDKITEIKHLIEQGNNFGAWDLGVFFSKKIIVSCNIMISWHATNPPIVWYGKLKYLFKDSEEIFKEAVGWNGKGYTQPVLILNPKKVEVSQEFFKELNEEVYEGNDEKQKLELLKKYGIEFDKIEEQSSEEPIISLKCINHPKNRILFGPPGTGKTFKTKEKAVKTILNHSYLNPQEESDVDKVNFPIINNIDEAKKNIITFNNLLQEKNPVIIKRLSSFRRWYYSESLEKFGPSKFIGYQNMTLEIYKKVYNLELKGLDTEKYFRKMDLKEANLDIHEKLKNLIPKFDKKLSEKYSIKVID